MLAQIWAPFFIEGLSRSNGAGRSKQLGLKVEPSLSLSLTRAEAWPSLERRHRALAMNSPEAIARGNHHLVDELLSV